MEGKERFLGGLFLEKEWMDTGQKKRIEICFTLKMNEYSDVFSFLEVA